MSMEIDLAAFPNQAVDYANYEDLDTKDTAPQYAHIAM